MLKNPGSLRFSSEPVPIPASWEFQPRPRNTSGPVPILTVAISNSKTKSQYLTEMMEPLPVCCKAIPGLLSKSRAGTPIISDLTDGSREAARSSDLFGAARSEDRAMSG
jgi:hypothetical protein